MEAYERRLRRDAWNNMPDIDSSCQCQDVHVDFQHFIVICFNVHVNVKHPQVSQDKEKTVIQLITSTVSDLLNSSLVFLW